MLLAFFVDARAGDFRNNDVAQARGAGVLGAGSIAGQTL